MSSPVPYYYADDGKFVLFLDLLGFTQFVRQSFQVPVESEADADAARKHFRSAQREVDRMYGRFQRHLGAMLRRPPRPVTAPTLSMVFSDCAYAVFERAEDAERFAISAMRSFVRNDMPVRMGLAYGSFQAYEFATETLPSGGRLSAAPFMGTAVIDAYRAESSGVKGLRVLVHPSFYLTTGDRHTELVPLPKAEQSTEAVGELNWYDLRLRHAIRRHVRGMMRAAPEHARVHYDRTLCFVRRMEEFRYWSNCCRLERVANVVYTERRVNIRAWRNYKRSKRYQRDTARARAEADSTAELPAQ